MSKLKPASNLLVVLVTAGLWAFGVVLVTDRPAVGDEKPKGHHDVGHDGHHHDGEVELAPYMAQFHRHSQKLGYAIEGRNGPLVKFYLHELEEVADEIAEKVPTHDNFPIRDLIGNLAVPAIESLEKDLAANDWRRLSAGYTNLIESCNRCHQATEHQFIVITPASGPSPYNQRYDLPMGLKLPDKAGDGDFKR